MTDVASVRPAASIIIVTYNGLRYLDRCLATVFPQLGEQGEVIIVDNCSTDGGPQFIREYYPAARLVENRSNRGFAAACNQGARLAAGRVLVFLNQDTEVQPGWLGGLVEPLDAKGSVGLTTSKLLLMAQPGKINLCGQDIHYAGLSFARGFMADSGSCPEPAWVGAVSGASFAIKRELWVQLGGFDESLYMYYEETDLCWRARLVGYRCQYRPDSLLCHDYRPGQHSYSRLYYSKRNRHILLLKHWRWATLLFLLPALLLAELLDVGQTVLIAPYDLRAKLKAYWWIVRHFSQIMTARRQVQRMRTAPDWQLLASCTSEVRLLELSGGILGRPLLVLTNELLRLNYRFALVLCRALDI